MKITRLALLIVVAAGSGCSTVLPAPQLPTNMAPTPYTAEQIRDANPPGTQLVFRVHEPPADPLVQTLRFVSADGRRTVIESSMQTSTGQLAGEPTRSESTWSELRDHAAFPADQTDRTLVTRDVAAGSFECFLYTVRDEDEEGNRIVRRFYFAWERPGPPVLMHVERNGQPSMTMELLQDSREAGG